MNIILTIHKKDTHVHFRIHVNGALAGNMILRRYTEYPKFLHLLKFGLDPKEDSLEIKEDEK